MAFENAVEGGTLPLDDFNDLKDDLERLMDAERLVTARLVESVLRTSRLAGTATPELQDLFREWLGVMGSHILEEVEGPARRDVAAWARELGIGL